MSVEAVKVEAQTSSGTRIRVPVLLERKDGRIYFWDGKVGTKTKYELSSEIRAMHGSHYHGYEDEGEGDRPTIGANRLDDAPHPGDPRRGEHQSQPEVALAVETALLVCGIRGGNARRALIAVPIPSDGSERREPAPAIDVEGFLDVPPGVLGRQFGLLQERLDSRGELLRRSPHQAAERTWANSFRRSSGTLPRNPGSNTRRGRVFFRKLTGS